ncbi:MAG: hypothetical protein ACREAR_03930 [Nitrosotalea sp.]
MTVNRKKKESIHLINSDEKILEVLEQSNQYLESNDKLSHKIEEILWFFRALEDLIPQTVENVFSGHMFSLIEANSELENSIALCKFGFYKHAFMALRSVVEMGVLSVYWDVDGKSNLDIQKWLLSFENTPSRKIVFTKLKDNQNFREYDDKHKLFDEGDSIFKQLSNFVHTKGHRHSTMDLGNANFNRFNESSLLKWSELMTRVTHFVIVLHILRYPVALQYTPIEQKFGMNGPAGGFFSPYQMERIKHFLDIDVIETLQKISNNDPEATDMAKWVNEQPDITDEELHIQAEKFDEMKLTRD